MLAQGPLLVMTSYGHNQLGLSPKKADPDGKLSHHKKMAW